MLKLQHVCPSIQAAALRPLLHVHLGLLVYGFSSKYNGKKTGDVERFKSLRASCIFNDVENDTLAKCMTGCATYYGQVMIKSMHTKKLPCPCPLGERSYQCHVTLRHAAVDLNTLEGSPKKKESNYNSSQIEVKILI